MNALFKRQWKEMRESKWIIVSFLFLILFISYSCTQKDNMKNDYLFTKITFHYLNTQ